MRPQGLRNFLHDTLSNRIDYQDNFFIISAVSQGPGMTDQVGLVIQIIKIMELES